MQWMPLSHGPETECRFFACCRCLVHPWTMTHLSFFFALRYLWLSMGSDQPYVFWDNGKIGKIICTLPESVGKPSARGFAECNPSCTRQTSFLSSAAKKILNKIIALGKRGKKHSEKFDTRQTRKKHSAKLGTWQRSMFVEYNYLALGKEICLPSVIIWHSTNNFIFFLKWPWNFFYSLHTTCGIPC